MNRRLVLAFVLGVVCGISFYAFLGVAQTKLDEAYANSAPAATFVPAAPQPATPASTPVSGGFAAIAAYNWPGSSVEPRHFSFAGDQDCYYFECTVTLQSGEKVQLRRMEVQALPDFLWMNDKQAAGELFTNSWYKVSRRAISSRDWEWVLEDSQPEMMALAAMQSDNIHW